MPSPAAGTLALRSTFLALYLLCQGPLRVGEGSAGPSLSWVCVEGVGRASENCLNLGIYAQSSVGGGLGCPHPKRIGVTVGFSYLELCLSVL